MMGVISLEAYILDRLEKLGYINHPEYVHALEKVA